METESLSFSKLCDIEIESNPSSKPEGKRCITAQPVGTVSIVGRNPRAMRETGLDNNTWSVHQTVCITLEGTGNTWGIRSVGGYHEYTGEDRWILT